MYTCIISLFPCTRTGLKSQTTLKIRSVYMAISLRPVMRSQATFRNCSIYTWRFHCGNFPNHSIILLHIANDSLQDRVGKLLKSGTLLNKSKRDKDSLRINGDKINDRSINISSLSTHSLPAASPTTSRISQNIKHKISNTKSRNGNFFVTSNITIQTKFTITQETAILFS